MSRYIVDAYAWIEYLKGSSMGESVKEIIEDECNDIFTVAVTIAEVMSIVKRENMDCDVAFKYVTMLSKILDVNPELSKETGLFHAEKKKRIKDFGLADAFIVVAAEKIGANILTGDPHFKGMRNATFI